jgi:hypothetical protein
MLFVRRRQRYPRANVEHQILHWPAEGRIVLHVIVRVTNVGEVVLRLRSTLARIQQLLPIPPDLAAAIADNTDPVEPNESEIQWPLVAERACDWNSAYHEVEPGEIEECHFDFILSPPLEKVEVYSYLRNLSKRGRDIGWNTTTVYSFTTGGERHGHEQDHQTSVDSPGSAQESATSTAAEAEGIGERGAKSDSDPPQTRQGPPKARPLAAAAGDRREPKPKQ